MAQLTALWKQEDGQDLAEYSLLIAFVVVVTAAFLTMNGQNIEGIWGVGTNRLLAGEAAAS